MDPGRELTLFAEQGWDHENTVYHAVPQPDAVGTGHITEAPKRVCLIEMDSSISVRRASCTASYICIHRHSRPLE